MKREFMFIVMGALWWLTPIATAQRADANAMAKEHAGRYADVIPMYQHLIKTNPASEEAADALFKLGSALERLTRFEEAAEAFAGLTDHLNHVNAPESLLRASLLYEALSDRDRAVELLEIWIKRWPNHPDSSQVYLKQGRLYEALDTRTSRAKARRLYARYVTEYGIASADGMDALLRQGRLIRKLSPTNVQARDILQRALGVYSTLKKNPIADKLGATASYELALIDVDAAQENGNSSAQKAALVTKAVNQLETVLVYQDTGLNACVLLAIAKLHMTLKPLREEGIRLLRTALEFIQQRQVYNQCAKDTHDLAIKIEPGRHVVLQQHRWPAYWATPDVTNKLFQAAQTVQWTGRTSESERLLARLHADLSANISKSPLSSQLKAEMALYWWLKGNRTKVVEQVKAAIEGAPQNRLALHLRALSALKAGKPSVTLWVLNQLIKRHPRSGAIHNSLGAAYLQLGDGQNALIHFKRALSLAPASLEVRMNLALLHLRFLNYARADAELSQVLTKEPAHVMAKLMQSSMRAFTPSEE